MRFNIVVPMAGSGERFGGVFKPFLELDGRTFLEHALSSFTDKDFCVFLIVTREQEARHKVTEWADAHVPGASVIALQHTTGGPLQSVVAGLRQEGLGHLENVVVCDCDLSVQVAPLVTLWERCAEGASEIVLATWPVTVHQHEEWGTATTSKDGALVSLQEKQIMPQRPGFATQGVIGCHFVRQAASLMVESPPPAFLTLFEQLRQRGARIELGLVRYAEFFGTPSQLEAANRQRRRRATVFCDADSVLGEHGNDNVAWLRHRRHLGDYIVLVARGGTADFEGMLGVTHDQLVTTPNSGPMVVVAGPGSVAHSVNVTSRISWDLSEGAEKEVSHFLSGGSGASVAVVRSKDGNHFVRKSAAYSQPAKVATLCEQFHHMTRLHIIAPHLVAAVTAEGHDGLSHWYDMPIVSGVQGVFSPEPVRLACRVLEALGASVYPLRRSAPEGWLQAYVVKKVAPRLEHAPDLVCLVNRSAAHPQLQPQWVGDGHGDLTMSNVMWNQEDDSFRLLDGTPGGLWVIPPELDLGKLCQSVAEGYEGWPAAAQPTPSMDGARLAPLFEMAGAVLGTSVERAKALAAFHLGCHLIRLLPYQQAEHGVARGNFVQRRARAWLTLGLEAADRL